MKPDTSPSTCRLPAFRSLVWEMHSRVHSSVSSAQPTGLPILQGIRAWNVAPWSQPRRLLWGGTGWDAREGRGAEFLRVKVGERSNALWMKQALTFWRCGLISMGHTTGWNALRMVKLLWNLNGCKSIPYNNAFLTGNLLIIPVSPSVPFKAPQIPWPD